MLKITDLGTEKALDHSEMAGITGGSSEFERFTALLDFSTSLMNKVADVNQQFGFSIAQGNSGAVTNNQTIIGGNGIVFAPGKLLESLGIGTAVIGKCNRQATASNLFAHLG